MPLAESLKGTWDHIQGFLFPLLHEEVGPLTETHRRVVIVLEVARPETFVGEWRCGVGRPRDDRRAIARAFVAKVVFGLSTTSGLIERLAVDRTLRRLCGWERLSQVPSEATFSRAFAEFARSGLPTRVHEALIKNTHANRLVGHISRDATAIEAREKPLQEAKPAATVKRGRGRPKKGFESGRPKVTRRLERQGAMSLAQMLADLPTRCTTGAKLNAKGHMTSWIGYKLHMDVADGDIPISCLLTSASLHDSQAAIPLATLTATRASSLYDLMDSAYDAPEIWAHSLALGHVPLIAKHPRNTAGKAAMVMEGAARRRANYRLAEDVRRAGRSTAERVNSALKDTYGGRHVRVRGHAKVACHLMFGVLALTVEQILRLMV